LGTKSIANSPDTNSNCNNAMTNTLNLTCMLNWFLKDIVLLGRFALRPWAVIYAVSASGDRIGAFARGIRV
jgi:hypothetical protein